MPSNLSKDDWELLLWRIKKGKCTPFLGAGACFGTLPLGSVIAENWAKEHKYPLDDFNDLVRVAQYISVKFNDSAFVKELLLEHFKKAGTPNFKDPSEIHGLLADLPLPVYMTTNYDDFMVQALRDRERTPKRALCQWNTLLKEQDSVFAIASKYNPTVDEPVVFHLHGHNEVPDSIVLTEDDYLDFLVNISMDRDLLPLRIQKAFVETSLLFLGYAIADWDFRVLFRSLVGFRYIEKSLQRAHVSVQLLPGHDHISKKKRDLAQKHLDSYFRDLHVRVHWGTCVEFAVELRRRWEEYSHDA